MYIRLIKANKEDWKILKRHDYDTENGKQYFYIEGPNGIYQDDNGSVYHFNTYEDALEELAYLRGEHDADKKKIKSSDDRYEVMREDLGKSRVYEGANRRFFIYDNMKNESVGDFDTGETLYFDTFQEASDKCEELNEFDEEWYEFNEDKKKS